MFIDGTRTRGTAAEAIDVLNPATEEVLAQVAAGGEHEVGLAVNAAARAFPGWRRTPATERAHYLHGAATRLREHHDELVRLLTQEEGKPVPESDEELVWTEDTLDYYAGLARHERGRVIPPGDPDQFNFVLKEPYGVVGCIVPWNYPLLLMIWKVAPALAAGNTVVIKPSVLTPLSTLRLAEVAFAGLPPGVANVVTGKGSRVGEALVQHPDVPVIACTGSLATGQRIAAQAAPLMKKLHLELGGKDPMVIGPDVELDLAVRALAYAGLINAGQVCTSTERVYVPRDRMGKFSAALTDFVAGLRLGDPLEPTTDVGPMIRENFRRVVDDQVHEAVAQGARLLCGGSRPDRRGFFYPPTVLVDVHHGMRLMRDETFGPVLPLMAYDGFDEAIRLANDTPYGLGASLMSHDPRLVKRFFEEVQAGTIWINDPLTDNYAGPFGGMKMSGLGRELGQEGLDEFTQVKHVHWDMVGAHKSYWYPYGEGDS
jgi:betaine-aldehyde dehydrogenase